MITVTISINAEPIYTRTAINMGYNPNGTCRYRLDDGTELDHFRDDGAIALAQRMLDTIEEIKKEH